MGSQMSLLRESFFMVVEFAEKKYFSNSTGNSTGSCLTCQTSLCCAVPYIQLVPRSCRTHIQQLQCKMEPTICSGILSSRNKWRHNRAGGIFSFQPLRFCGFTIESGGTKKFWNFFTRNRLICLIKICKGVSAMLSETCFVSDANYVLVNFLVSVGTSVLNLSKLFARFIRSRIGSRKFREMRKLCLSFSLVATWRHFFPLRSLFGCCKMKHSRLHTWKSSLRHEKVAISTHIRPKTTHNRPNEEKA